jgi:hypothetical protein
MEASGLDMIWGAIPVFARREWENPLTTFVKIVGLRVEIWTRDLPNT